MLRPTARLAGLAAALLLVAPSAAPVASEAAAPATTTAAAASAVPQEAPAWQAVHIDEVRRLRAEHGRPWQEFMRSADLFAGLYEIPVGGSDEQRPHDADEVYYVLEGRATLVVDEDRYAARPGSVIFVAKGRDHRFVDIAEDLSVLVFFATPGGD